MSIRTRLLLLILFATLIPTLIAGLQFLQRRDAEIATARQDVVVATRRVTEDLKDMIGGTAQLHFGLARARDLETPDRAACSAFLADVLKQYAQYTGILTITPQGDLWCDSLQTGRELHLADRRYFQEALHAGSALALEPAFGRLTGIAVLQIASAARHETGAPKFVLLASLNLEKYMQARGQLLRSQNVVTALLDSQGTILTWYPAGEKRRGTSLADAPLFRLARGLDGAQEQDDPQVDGVSRIWAAGTLPEFPGAGLHVLVGIAKQEVLAAANYNLVQALSLLTMGSLLVFASAWALVEWSLRRQTARIVTAVARFSDGNFDTRIGTPYPRGELGSLMATMDEAFALMQTQRAKIKRLTRVYAVLSAINGLIVRVSDRDALLHDACRIVVEVGAFARAWLGLIDEEAMRVKPVAWQGVSADDMQSIPLALNDTVPEQYGLSGKAISTRSPMIVNSLTEASRLLLNTEVLEDGIRAVAVLPLIVSDRALGVMALYAGEAGVFDAEETNLLRELAGDISFALDHIAKNEQLDYLAYYDAVTGLANRTLFQDRLTQFMAAARRERHKLALAILDVERFTTINDTLGWAAGDTLLKQMAHRIVSLTPDMAWVARIGADHFAIMAPDIQHVEDLAWLKEARLEALFGAPFHVGATELRIAAKWGVAIFPDDGADAETLLANAEAALKRAKAGGDRYLYYTRTMTKRVAEKMTLENKLRQALKKDEFVLYYQPKVNLTTGCIVGAEALIRWQSPELGLVPPMQFIPLMEETGLILPVGAWALKRAALDHRRLVHQELHALRIAVNVSSIQLRQRDFVSVVAQALREGMTPVGIDLEITESFIMEDIQSSIDKLTSIRGLGVNIAIDDFGTGYSSLAYLAKLPVQTLKIDRSFIITMLHEPETMLLVQTIISMAHALKLNVVAEGVDAEGQAQQLRLLSCDEMQGYLFSPPVPFDQLQALLMEGVKG